MKQRRIRKWSFEGGFAEKLKILVMDDFGKLGEGDGVYINRRQMNRGGCGLLPRGVMKRERYEPGKPVSR